VRQAPSCPQLKRVSLGCATGNCNVFCSTTPLGQLRPPEGSDVQILALCLDHVSMTTHAAGWARCGEQIGAAPVAARSAGPMWPEWHASPAQRQGRISAMSCGAQPNTRLKLPAPAL